MTHLTTGDPAPWFEARTPLRPDFQFATAAGRMVVLSFIGSAGTAVGRAMLEVLQARAQRFDNRAASLFIVSQDVQDEQAGRIAHGGGVHLFWDFDARIAELYGLAKKQADGKASVMLASLVLDPMLRVIAVIPFKDAPSHAQALDAALDAPVATGPAPVLLLPRVFEPEFCRHLISLYETSGGEASGFMQTDPATGKTVLRTDERMKRRRDHIIEDDGVQRQVQARLHRRLVPEVRKAFQFEATRIERYIVACYGAEDGGHFSAHRDNTTKGTAHRRFAVTINLNAQDYEGGDLVFPEFGQQTWRAPTGGAVVFSCSLMHEARPVTRGSRYCFLPFLYDEAAAKIRAENRGFVDLQQR